MDFTKKTEISFILSENLNLRPLLLYFQNSHKPSKYKHSHPFNSSKSLPYFPIINKIQQHIFKTKFASKEKIDLSIHIIANRNR